MTKDERIVHLENLVRAPGWEASYALFVAEREVGLTGLRYALQKLCSEAGEALQILAEAERKSVFLDPAAIALELGDVMWSLQSAATHIGTDMPTIAEMNKKKLRMRDGDGKNPIAELAMAVEFLK